MATNPIEIRIPGESNGKINCVSNASFYQRVTLTNSINKTTVVFSGIGEAAAMQTEDGSYTYLLPSTRQDFSIFAKFEYSKTGQNGPFISALINHDAYTVEGQDGQPTVVKVTSEDDTDNDNNDSYLTISYCQLR